MLRDWGQERKLPPRRCKGYNYRMEGIQGAILRVKLRHLEAVDRGAAARTPPTTTRSSPAPAIADCRPRSPDAAPRLPRLRRARSPSATGVQQRLDRAAIATGIHYPVPVHLQPAYADLGYRPRRLPGRRSASRGEVALAADVSRS